MNLQDREIILIYTNIQMYMHVYHIHSLYIFITYIVYKTLIARNVHISCFFFIRVYCGRNGETRKRVHMYVLGIVLQDRER